MFKNLNCQINFVTRDTDTTRFVFNYSPQPLPLVSKILGNSAWLVNMPHLIWWTFIIFSLNIDRDYTISKFWTICSIITVHACNHIANWKRWNSFCEIINYAFWSTNWTKCVWTYATVVFRPYEWLGSWITVTFRYTI